MTFLEEEEFEEEESNKRKTARKRAEEEQDDIPLPFLALYKKLEKISIHMKSNYLLFIKKTNYLF